MERWQGKTAVVTGASAGIGAAVCLALANAGLKVVGLARRPHLIEELKKQVTGTGCIVSHQCDVSKTEEIADAFRWIEDNHNGIDVLVNNAASFKVAHITDLGDSGMSEEEIVTMLDTNIRAAIICTRHAANSMKKRDFDGHIININSLAGHYVPFSSTFNLYPTTKYAITAFTDSLSNEIADCRRKIKTTSISPGLVSTDMTEPMLTQAQWPSLRPTDIADAILYVVSTPAHVNISELTISPVQKKKL